MNIYTRLKEDHDRVKEILEKIASSSPTAVKKRETLFTLLKTELMAHSKVEEAVFYATLKPEKSIKEDVLEALNEHHVVDLLLAELDSIPKDNEHWKAKFSFLKEVIEHHVEEEEDQIFKKAKKVISKDLAEDLGEIVAQREEAIKEALEPVI